MPNPTIPQTRTELTRLADDLRLGIVTADEAADKIDGFVDDLYRRPYARKASARSVPVTPALARKIKRACEANPDVSYQRIATKFKVNAGRVSEIMAGFRA